MRKIEAKRVFSSLIFRNEHNFAYNNVILMLSVDFKFNI